MHRGARRDDLEWHIRQEATMNYPNRIPGSKYFREYCACCGEPMRVVGEDVGTEPWCVSCRHGPPAQHTGLTPRQKHGLKNTGG